MTDFNKPTTLEMKGNLSGNWLKWKKQFNLYMVATGYNKKPDEQKVAMLVNLLGTDAQDVYDNFVYISPETSTQYDVVMKKFEQYCLPRVKVVVERFNFTNVVQKEGQSFDSFLTELQTKSSTCNFGDQKDSLIRDRIIFGIRNKKIQERLLEDDDVSLEKTVSMCRSSELSQLQVKILQETPQEVNAVKTMRQKFRPRDTSNKQKESRPMTKDEEYQCGRCGTRHKVRKCPAYQKECFNCKGRGHFTKMCKKPPSKQVKELECSQSDYLIEEVSTVSVLSVGKEEAWYTNLQMEGKTVKFKLDTGAQCNVLPLAEFKTLPGQPNLKNTNTVLMSFGKYKIKPVGTTQVSCKSKGKQFSLEFVVTEVDSQPLLSLQTCVDLGLIRRVDSLHAFGDMDSVVNQYQDVFGGLGTVPGEHHIELDPTVKPVIHPPRKVPFGLQERLRETLDKLESTGVIRKVDHPTPWVNSLVIVEKKNGEIRLCLDPLHLNRAVRREHYKIPTAEDIAVQMNGKKYFSTLDLRNGFWHIRLDEESANLCTFNSPFGRYQFCRFPFGIKSGPEVFQKKVVELFGDIPGVNAVFDDLIIAGATLEEHDETLKKVLERARQNNIKFNQEKFKFRLKSVSYLGHELSEDGLKPDLERVRAIVKMDDPTNKEELRRFLGMVTYLAQFIPKLSETTAPLRLLLREQIPWHWEEDQKNAVAKLKKNLCEAPVLKFFDVKKQVTIQTDASQNGLGACLMQEGHPIAYASKSLTETEGRWSQIEKEMYGIVYAVEHFNQYTYGRQVLIQTDHKPLVPIMKKEINKVTHRLQRMILKLMRYDLQVTYVPGKELFLADTLSRAFQKDPVEDDPELCVVVHQVAKYLSVSPQKQEETRKATKEDETLKIVLKYHQEGWPTHIRDVHLHARPFWKVRGELSEHDGLLFMSERLVVPLSMRSKMLTSIHEGHQGIEKCKTKARTVLYWPGMDQQIEEIVQKCSTCEKFQNSNQKEPLLPETIPDRPWQKIASDIFEFKGKSYLVIFDYFSKWLEIEPLSGKTSKDLIQKFKTAFSRHGVPEIMRADNMPYNSSELQSWAKEWDLQIVTSSPTYSQSNGCAEKAVQIAKKMLKKAEDDGTDHYTALMNYHSTPIQGLHQSPAQLLMGRQIRTKLPTQQSLLIPKITALEETRQNLQQRQMIQKRNYDQHSKPLCELQEGESILVQKDGEWKKAVVVKPHSSPRSYIVRTEDDAVYRRNRRDLRQSVNPPPTIIPDIPIMINSHNNPPDSVNPTDNSLDLNLPCTHNHNPEALATKISQSYPDRSPRPQRERKVPVKLSDYEL